MSALAAISGETQVVHEQSVFRKRPSKGIHTCDVCQQQFTQMANLKRHQAKHTDRWNYECRYCDKQFLRNDQKNEHLLTHLKQRNNFNCPVRYCSMRFFEYSGLVEHVNSHQTSIPSANCKLCNKVFDKTKRLLTHFLIEEDEFNEKTEQTPAAKRVKSEESTEDIVSVMLSMFNQSDQTSSESSSANTRSVSPADSPTTLSNPSEDIDWMSVLMSNQETTSESTSISPPSSNSSPGSPISPEDAKLMATIFKLTENQNMPLPDVPPVSQLSNNSSECSSAPTLIPVENHLQCLPCGIRFDDQFMFMIHQHLHSNENRFKCNLCGHQCNDKYEFSSHMILSDHGGEKNQ